MTIHLPSMRGRFAAAALAASLLLVGCGGDDGATVRELDGEGTQTGTGATGTGTATHTGSGSGTAPTDATTEANTP